MPHEKDVETIAFCHDRDALSRLGRKYVTLLTLGFERDIVILVSGVVALWVTMLAPLTVQAKLNEQS